MVIIGNPGVGKTFLAQILLYNTTIAAAIADRLVENSEIFLLGGESLRKAQKSPPPAA